MGRKTTEARKTLTKEVKARDEAKALEQRVRSKVQKRLNERKTKNTRKPFKRAPVCCLDKGNLPSYFRPCVDCPKTP